MDQDRRFEHGRRLVRALFLAWVLLVFLAGPSQAQSEPPIYDPDRVIAHAQFLAETVGIRPAGSSAEGRAAGYIAGVFAQAGLDVRIQGFRVFERNSQNVIATKEGTSPGAGIIYVGAHYDSVVWGPGANDNASGVAVLLEVARMLASEPLSATVRFIAFGSEEASLTGSFYYVATIGILDRIMSRAMINMDCVAVGNGQQIAFGSSNSMGLAERIATVGGRSGSPLPVVFEGRSDHLPFSQSGIPAAMIFTHTPGQTPCGPYYHRAGDRLDTLEPAQMERVAKVLLESIRLLSAEPINRNPSEMWLPTIFHR